MSEKSELTSSNQVFTCGLSSLVVVCASPKNMFVIPHSSVKLVGESITSPGKCVGFLRFFMIKYNQVCVVRKSEEYTGILHGIVKLVGSCESNKCFLGTRALFLTVCYRLV